MKQIILAGLLVVASGCSFAIAGDDEPTADEKTKIEAALAEAGCAGGEIELKDYGFKVEEAECDGKEYDIKLDKDFKITAKKEE